MIKKHPRFTLIEKLIFFSMGLALLVGAGCVYVLLHFILKFW